MARRLLIADDDRLMRTFLAVSLSAFKNIESVEADDGNEALAQITACDAAILGWYTRGLEITREVRAQGCRIPILLMTSEARKEKCIEALHAGISDYLIWPFEMEVLRGKVLRMLDQ